MWQPENVTAHRPQVVAHRGASAREPEHTLAAYTEAIKVGSDALECDVRLTADGHLVCVHDRSVRRTSNGRGLVSTLELTDLQGLDWGSWKARDEAADADDEEPDVVTEDDRSHLLTLKRLLGLVADTDRHVEVAIETKHPTRYAGLVEKKLVELLEEFGWTGAGSPVRVMSFSPVALGRITKLAPGLEVVLLIDRQYAWKMALSVLGPGWIVGPGIDLLRENPKLGRYLRKKGRRIHVWTVNTPSDIDLCVKLGVEALITDAPGLALDHLDGPSTFRP